MNSFGFMTFLYFSEAFDFGLAVLMGHHHMTQPRLGHIYVRVFGCSGRCLDPFRRSEVHRGA